MQTRAQIFALANEYSQEMLKNTTFLCAKMYFRQKIRETKEI
jgi:hypothetical protein